MVTQRFIWETAAERDRAEMVRRSRYLKRHTLLSAFCLTEYGLDMILRGDNWRPEYEAPLQT